MKELIIALGTNTNRAENLARCKAELLALFPDISFTQAIETEPIGLNCPNFLNALAWTHTEKTYDLVRNSLKSIERKCGDSREKRADGRVELDLDILKYGGKRFHQKDWERPYIKQLMETLTKKYDINLNS